MILRGVVEGMEKHCDMDRCIEKGHRQRREQVSGKKI